MTKEEREAAISYLETYRKIDEELFKMSPQNSVAHHAAAQCLKYWDMAIEALKQEPCEDAVSRKQVITEIKKWWRTALDAKGSPLICEIIKNLPPVQPKQEPPTKNDLALINTEGLDEGIRCAMCTNSMANDRGCDGSCVVNNGMYKAVMDAIGKRIQPTTKNDLGVDAISRQAINGYIDYILSHGMGKKKSFDFIKKFVANLPSVTPQEPRKGHWIYLKHNRARCSECDDVVLIAQQYGQANYCPNCGADMREVEE